MDRRIDLLDATRRMDLDGIKDCLATDPASILAVDPRGNNAMHICVLGGASIRAPHIMTFFVEATDIDLLQANADGLDSLRLAITLNDEEACELIEPQWHDQLDKKYPLKDEPGLSVVGSSEPIDPTPH